MDRKKVVEVALAIDKHLDRMCDMNSLDCPHAYGVGGSVFVKFAGQPTAKLSDEDAIAYLAWLDAGSLGDLEAWRSAVQWQACLSDATSSDEERAWRAVLAGLVQKPALATTAQVVAAFRLWSAARTRVNVALPLPITWVRDDGSLRLAWVRGEATDKQRMEAFVAANFAARDTDRPRTARLAAEPIMGRSTAGGDIVSVTVWGAAFSAAWSVAEGRNPVPWPAAMQLLAPSLLTLFPYPARLDWRDALSRWDDAVFAAQQKMERFSDGAAK